MDVVDISILLGFCFAFCLLILWTYTLGLRNGQKLAKKEEIVMPNVNPVTAINNQIEKNEIKKEQDLMNIMLSNIDNYDGSGVGQKDIPY